MLSTSFKHSWPLLEAAWALHAAGTFGVPDCPGPMSLQRRIFPWRASGEWTEGPGLRYLLLPEGPEGAEHVNVSVQERVATYVNRTVCPGT